MRLVSGALPTRLLAVDGSTPDIRLCLAADLLNKPRYLALSHTWGERRKRLKAMPLLLKNNMSARKERIPWDELTKTFQDAITITKELGLQYIWIDSLCIVQDDKEDWASEAGRMAFVYSNAYLVVAATASETGDDGCFRTRCPSHNIAACGAYENVSNVHVQRQVCHRTICEWQAISTSMPLLDRAWCFQERLLATRILHYTEDEVMWECQECLWCECDAIKHEDHTSNFKIAHAEAMVSFDYQTRVKSWAKVLTEYSQRSLTVGTDRLPGISGIAKAIALPEMGRYLAGLWESQLPQALLWSYGRNVVDRPDVQSRSAEYQAPTWSWASTSTAVRTYHESSSKAVCRVIEICCTPAMVDPFGHILDGHLKIAGPSSAVLLKRTTRKYSETRYDVLSRTTDDDMQVMDVTFTSDVELHEGFVSATILMIQVDLPESGQPRWGYGLMLVPSTRQSECWERIGHVSGKSLTLIKTNEAELTIL